MKASNQISNMIYLLILLNNSILTIYFLLTIECSIVRLDDSNNGFSNPNKSEIFGLNIIKIGSCFKYC